MAIIIEICKIGSDHGYRATFAYEEQALQFCSVRQATHVFRELEDHQLPDDCGEALYALMYPKCTHGLSLELCAGPQHYDYDEDELRGMGLLG